MEAVYAVTEATHTPAPRFPEGSTYGVDTEIDPEVLAEIEAQLASATTLAPLPGSVRGWGLDSPLPCSVLRVCVAWCLVL
jgi:hypothetical protein